MKRWKRKRATLGASVAIALVAIASVAFAFGTGTGAVRADARSGDENAPTEASNRWAIVFDASRPAASSEAQARIDAAREKFCADLEASGILPDHIFVFTSTAKDEARRPTREAILNALETLRDVDGVCELYPERPDEDKPFWRGEENDDGNALCEAQIYLTAPGVAASDGGSDWFAPCDAPLENVDEATRAETWLRVEAIEDALTRPEDERATPIQRTFLAINFLTLEAKTRGDARKAALSEVDLERSVARSVGDMTSRSATRYRHVRASTKNERWDARTVDSFYRTMSDGLSGCADLAGDRNGWVEAGELAEYVRANGRESSVAIAQNGNAVYSLCPSRREWSVPTELYREIERTFTRPEFQDLRDSASRRIREAEAAKKGATK